MFMFHTGVQVSVYITVDFHEYLYSLLARKLGITTSTLIVTSPRDISLHELVHLVIFNNSNCEMKAI